MNYINIPIIKISQNIGSFFIGKMAPKILHKIANKNLSRMKDLENGIQRDLYPEKVKAIKKYLKSNDSTFPNTIILAIQNNPAEEKEPNYVLNNKNNTLKIKIKEDVANILDGQHRLAGFDKEEEKFELPVSVFLDLSLGEQAKIFAQINSTQRKVSNDLVYDLFGITEGRSPEKSAYYIVKHLNEELNSAWYMKIKTLSDKTGDLAQGSMAKYIHIELLEKNKIFKKLYEKNRDTDIKNIISNYFNAIKKIFPEAWENKNKQYILTKTTGFNGFMNFLILLVRLASDSKKELSEHYFMNYITRINDKFDLFTSENYPSGAVGQNKIRDTLKDGLTDEEKTFLNIKYANK
ncbi:DGQHR domain-containing protein [bacterium]|nr:DGQHR domain-containing protein [bacterium]